MKTVCPWDNVACLVDHIASPALFPYTVILGAILGASLLSYIWKE